MKRRTQKWMELRWDNWRTRLIDLLLVNHRLCHQLRGTLLFLRLISISLLLTAIYLMLQDTRETILVADSQLVKVWLMVTTAHHKLIGATPKLFLRMGLQVELKEMIIRTTVSEELEWTSFKAIRDQTLWLTICVITVLAMFKEKNQISSAEEFPMSMIYPVDTLVQLSLPKVQPEWELNKKEKKITETLRDHN